MEQRRCVVLKTAGHDGSESRIKSSTDAFPSVIERIIGCTPKHKVNIVQCFNKVFMCILALWILNCPSNQTNVTENWDHSSNNGNTGITPKLGANKKRFLSQVDVLRMTTYGTNYCKPWDKACRYTEVPNVRVKMPPPGVPLKGSNNIPSYRNHAQGPPNRFPQDMDKVPPPRGLPNRFPQDMDKVPPPRGLPNRFPQDMDKDMDKVPPPRGLPNRFPQDMNKVPPPRGLPNDSPSSSASGCAEISPSVNKPEEHSGKNLPPFPAKKCAPKKHAMLEHNKKFLQQMQANRKLEFINPSYQNLNDMRKDRDNNIIRRSPPRNAGENAKCANNVKIPQRRAPQQIRVPEGQTGENEFWSDFSNTIMSNINEVEMERNPVLELIKENVIDNIILANRRVRENIDMIGENIASTVDTFESGDCQPPTDLIKERLLDKVGSLEAEDIKPKFEEVKDDIIGTVTRNIECTVKPTLDNIKLTVLDTWDDINNEVVQPTINDIKDTINRHIGNLEYDVMPKIGKTIQECVADKIVDISTGIGKTSETIKDTVISNVKSMYDNVPIPKNIKEMTNKITPDPNVTMEQKLINSVSKSTFGFNIFGYVTNRFKNLGNTTKAIGSLSISFVLAIGGVVGLISGTYAAGGAVLFLALIFAYYAIIKLFKNSFLGKLRLKKNIFSKKKSKENKNEEKRVK
ncbi:hypothetical protein AK88_01156 [Plasmodium fragile]|uniref:Uncharacterized protein n=1 Tax=Plasmodium fragile TaxID=5857 RepID=A0A0D9QTU7_PLAFR|nr:uncharacterized protein AK88_01156 [Plasmodium fragile]KJP89276.1 hypothetical protein AK88_01156 [Plasmodium fragile]